ncbi:uncharacterized protein LOC113295069 [Papaver somniferum]|uniref:uncharacterized protein LOC113295069 n=1 Tax=Papaver somniferum TaxID=3469 RepID=UPI000E6F8C68|nr:uncharacterized protein LOC113295069 [Papaver somniferum]
MNIKSVIQEAMQWYNMEISAGELESTPDETDILESQIDSLRPPEGQKMKINFDGAAGPKGFACGAVARDCNARFKGCQNKILIHCKAVETVGNGALLAVEMARRKGFKEIIVEGDSLIVINALKYAHYKPDWRLQNIINKIREELQHFKPVEFRYIKKTANDVAHNVAALAVKNHSSNEWTTSPTSCIAQLIESEYSPTL